jgi:hypothetical protein
LPIRILKKVILIVFIYLVVSTSFISCAAEEGKVILLVMDRISWKEIYVANTPSLDRIMDMGAIGLMTTNTGGSLSQINAYLTIGSGARVAGVSGSQQALSYGHRYRGVMIEDLMYQITGYEMVEGAIGNPFISKLHRGNANRPYRVSIGALGTALREARLKVAVLGNCDNYKRLEGEGGGKNFLVSMMMDDRGIVSLGDVSQSLIIEDANWPMGIRTDYDKMLEVFKKIKDQAHVIAIQLGDTSRAEDFRHQAMDSRIEYHKIKAIEAGDKFIGKLLDNLDPAKDYIMLLSPVPPAEEIGNNNRLSPIIIAGKEIKKGWLTSGSTHREGVVTNLDIGASILNFFGLHPLPGQGGAPIYSITRNEGIEDIIKFNARLVNIYNQRPFLLRSYVFIMIPILTLAAVCLLFKRKYLKLMKPMLVFLMAIPLVYLILPLFQQPQLYKTAITALALSVLIVIILCRVFTSTMDRITVISGLTTFTLLIDQWLGMKLIQFSPLGYDVIAGARFYGIGNEYMGVLVGAICCFGAALIEKINKKKRISIITKIGILLIGIVAIYTMALPNLGANVGGTIAIFIAISTTTLMVQGKKIRIRNLAAIGVMVILILAVVFYIDSLQVVDSQSHLGQTVTTIKENGVGELFNIFYRKISMNIRLMRTTMWTRVFLTSLGVIVLLLYRPVGIFRDVYKKHQIIIKGLTGAAIGAIAAFIFNDSGIVAAATATIFIAPPFVLLIMDEIEKKVRDGVWQDGIHLKT